MDELVSIIVPVYNGEPYVERCIRSLVGQSCRNIEILLIDDGSTDRSYEICSAYAEKYSNIHAFHKENGGVSSTRNLGLDQAAGTFVTFVDADDYLDPVCIQTLLDAQKKSGADIVVSNAIDFYEDGTTEVGKNAEETILLTREDGIYHFIKEDLYTTVCWGRLYRRSSIGEMRFDERMRIAEDGKFFLGMIEKSSRICVIPERLYHYYIRSGSAAHSGFTEKYLDVLGFCEEMARTYKGAGRLEEAAQLNRYGFVCGLLERKDLPPQDYVGLLPRAREAYREAKPYLSGRRKVKFHLLSNPLSRGALLRLKK